MNENQHKKSGRLIKKIDFNSFKFKVWITLMSFAVIIIGLLWISQVIFLEYYLNSYKLNEFRSCRDELISSSESQYNILEGKFGFTIDVLKEDDDKYIVEYSSNGLNFGSKDQIVSDKSIISESLKNTNEDKDSLIKNNKTSRYYYCAKLNNGRLLFLSQSTEIIDSTVKILRTQMVIASITILVLITCLSVIVSAIFTKDISKLSDSAKKLAKSDYSVVFEEKGNTEIAEIASALNYATKEMAVTTNLRRELIANVSHDLRTPLTIIKGHAEMIKDITGDNKAKREQQLDVIIKETDRLTILVRDMLELSRLEANPELDKKALSLSDIVTDVFDSLSIYNEKDGYNITADIDDDLLVFADRTRLQLATYNLISNAINYTGEDKRVEIRLKRTGDKARFEVKDTGDGIPDENIKKIWERYYRAKEHKRSVAGNGLGLSIVKTILELHQAEFGVDSVLGEGSVFWYEINLIDK